jgi:hypothetical protein
MLLMPVLLPKIILFFTLFDSLWNDSLGLGVTPVIPVLSYIGIPLNF